MSRHTPGPWWRDDDGFISAGSGDDYVTIADPQCSDMDIDEREANARLIAAAPTMIDLLRSAADELQNNQAELCSDMNNSLAMEINKLLQEIER
jgi:hypothetical protein